MEGCRLQQASGLLGDDLFADHLAYGAGGAAGGAVNVALQPCLVGIELVLDGGLVEVLHPAFCGVGRGSLLRCRKQCIGVQR
jgi:hypothetical protein